jgi:hypothetical protein
MYVVVASYANTFRILASFFLVVCTIYLFLPYRDYGWQLFGEFSPVSSDVEEVVTLLKSRNTTGSMYVGVENHDKMSSNEPAIYFLTGGRFGTKYHELHPGVVTTKQVQEEIIQDLVTNDVQTVVLSKGFREEPNDSQYDHRIDLLDRHIRNSYAQVANLSKYSVWEKLNTTRGTGAAGGTGR